MSRLFNFSCTEKNKEIFHYTTLDALINGIIAPQPSPNNEICLWATHSKYLNDPSETTIGIDKAHKLLSQYLNEEINKESMFNDALFVISFSLKYDYLPMWSMYGKNGNGIMLIFDYVLLNSEDHFFIQCLYDNETRLEVFEKLFVRENSRLKRLTFADIEEDYQRNNIIHFPVAIKSCNYNYEEEVRYVTANDEFPETCYRVSNNIVVPYKKVYFHKKVLKKIVIGPTADFERTADSLKEYLVSKGFDHVDIVKSNVPYRV